MSKRVATRELASYYPWILAGTFLLYLITFPVLREPGLISIPVLMASWFYYRRAGIIATVLSVFINLILIQNYIENVSWFRILQTNQVFAIGSVILLLVSHSTGYLREVIESLYRREQRLRSEERFLVLEGIITKKILEHSNRDGLDKADSNDLSLDIIHHLTNLFVADSGYLIRWEAAPSKALLMASTNSAEISSASNELDPQEARIAAHALQNGQILAIEDLSKSPYAASAGEITHPARSIQSALCIPLIAREYQFGAAVLAYHSTHRFKDEEIKYAERIGYQLTLALWGLRQDQVNFQQLEKMQIMVKVGQALSVTERIGLDTVLQLIVDSARDLIPAAEQAVIHLVDADENLLIARAISGFDETPATSSHLRMQLGHGVAGQVVRDGIAINIGDIHMDPRFLPSKERPGYSSLLVAPIQTSGRPIGTISVESRSTYAFSDLEVQLLVALGSQAAIAIENTRLFETTAHSLEELGALYRINQRLVASLDPEILMKEVVDLLQESFHYYHVQVYLVDFEQRALVFRQGSGEIGTKLKSTGHCLLPEEGIIGHAAYTRKPFITNDVEKIVFYVRQPLLRETKSELAVPIKINDEVLGVLDILQTKSHRLTERDVQIASAVAEQLAVALQKANLYANMQRALEQEKAMRSQLVQSERLALVGRLLASVSHELNNPLQAIQNALFLLKEETHLSGQGKQDLDIILSEAERMAALIERLRSAYRPLRATEFQPVHLNNLIEDVYALINTHMRHKEIAFEFIPESQLLPAAGISDQLRQVVLNLFLNAVEVMQPGGRLTVATHNLVDQNEVLISVKDTGPGIDPKILPRIFDPFITSKHTGTGLGLTITHDILEQHHGRIRAENHPQGGAVFSVWLPIHEGDMA